MRMSASLVAPFEASFWWRLRGRMLRLKPIEEVLRPSDAELRRVLTWFDLLGLGVGSIVGAGLFVLTGIAARQYAGPSIILSYLFAGVACVFSGLCYAEFAVRIPVAGSAYVYAYCALGEFTAWMVGWNLILEYVVAVAAVARGWSSYLVALLAGFNVQYPDALYRIPFNCVNGTETPEAIEAGDCNTVDLTAFTITVLLTIVTAFGTKTSSTINAIMMAVTLLTIFFVIALGSAHVDPTNWSNFFPFGLQGMVHGAAVIFFSYVGFDSVSTFAEESKNPKRDMPIGVVGSITISTILYCVVALVITGMVPYYEIDLNAPLAAAFAAYGMPWASVIVSLGAFLALTTTILTSLMGMPRIFLAMSRDGLFFPIFKYVSPRFNTPLYGALITGGVAAALTIAVDINILADMVSIGTLFAFLIVCGAILILRLRSAERPQKGTILVLALIVCLIPPLLVTIFDISPIIKGLLWIIPLPPVIILFREPRVPVPPNIFVTPLVPTIPILGVMANLYLMLNLGALTWIRFVVWIAVGLIIYIFYGVSHSKLNKSLQSGDSESFPITTRQYDQLADDSAIADDDDENEIGSEIEGSEFKNYNTGLGKPRRSPRQGAIPETAE